MKITIDGVTYEFDNSNTDAIYNKQKEYVTKLINESQEKEKLEELLTSLLALQNITEVLLEGILLSESQQEILNALNAKEISR